MGTNGYERRLLRKQINLKLHSMSNHEAQENDYIQSSQLLTERQKMYMIIAKYQRSNDNARTSKKIMPFLIENTSLPHVNVARINRLLGSAKAILRNSDEVDKVIKAHSFRTETPYYTNPKLTIERGNFLNYSQHVGTLLHTPRYIDFLKEFSGSKSSKRNRNSKLEKSTSESSQNSNRSSTSYDVTSSLYNNSQIKKSSSKSSSSNATKASIRRESASISLSLSNRSEMSTEKNSQCKDSSLILYSEKENKSLKLDLEDENDGRENRPLKNNELLLDTSITDKNTSDIKEFDEEVKLPYLKSGSNQIETADRNNTDEMKKLPDYENNDIRKEKQIGLERIPEIPPTEDKSSDSILMEIKIFFNSNNISKDDFRLMDRHFDSVHQFRHNRPSYIKDNSLFLEKKNNKYLNMFTSILNINKIAEMKDEEANEIRKFLNKYEKTIKAENLGIKQNNSLITNVTYNIENNEKKKSLTYEEDNIKTVKDDQIKEIDTYDSEEEEILDKFVKEEISRVIKNVEEHDILYQKNESSENSENKSNINENIQNSVENNNTNEFLNRNPDRFNKTNEIAFEKEDETEYEECVDVDFTESFQVLFRSSISGITIDEMEELKKLVTAYDIMIHQHQKTETPLNESDEYDDVDFSESFHRLFRNSIGDMKEQDIIAVQKLVENFENTDDQDWWLVNDNEEIEDNEQVNSFKKLFRSSIGNIDKNDLENIKKTMNTIQNERKLSKISFQENDWQSIKSDNSDLIEENEKMFAFKQLFRNSIGNIKTDDLMKISKLIEEHEINSKT